MVQQAVMLNRVGEELASAFDVAKADNIEFQEITENAARSMDDLITQLDEPPSDSFQHIYISFRAWKRS